MKKGGYEGNNHRFLIGSAALFVPALLTAVMLVLSSCSSEQATAVHQANLSRSANTSDSPYDWRKLTIEPSATEPAEYEVPAQEDMTQFYRSSPTIAPPENPRLIAEWEPVQAVVIRYPLGISVDTVKLMASELSVYVLCASSLQSAASQAFKRGGVAMENIKFVTCVTDSYWTRDYGAWWMESGPTKHRKICLAEASYRANGERPNDDKVPSVLAGYLNLPTYYSVNFVCQGGNIMTDGANTGVSTDRVHEENPGLNLSKLAQLGKSMLGFNTYYLVADPAYPSDYIKHLNCWTKFLPGSKVLVKRVPATSQDYHKYESAAREWAGRINASGHRYEVVRVDGPEDAPYCSHVVLNKRVLVPIQGTGADKAALDQIKAAYGHGYRVTGVKAPPNAPWLANDALHCRINSVPVLP